MEDYMQKNKLNRAQLANKFNVTKGYITQILNGDFDHKISKLIDISLACGKVPVITFIDVDKYIKDDEENKPHYLNGINYKPVQFNTWVFAGSDIENNNPYEYNLNDSFEFSKIHKLEVTESVLNNG